MRKVLLVILGLLFVGVWILLLPSLNGSHPLLNAMHYFVWGNVVNVETIGDLNSEKVTIVFQNEFGINKHRDYPVHSEGNTRFKNRIIEDTIFF